MIREKLIGLKNSKKLLEDIPSKIKNYLGIICAVNLQKEKEISFIEIDVKPYTNPISYKGKFYTRSGSSTHELNGVELTDFVLKKSGETWDNVIVQDATIENIDTKAISKLIEDSKATKRLPDTNGLSTIEILQKLHLIKDGKLKRAAIVLFAKDPNYFIPNCVVKIGRFGIDGEDLKFQEVLEGNLIYLLYGYNHSNTGV